MTENFCDFHTVDTPTYSNFVDVVSIMSLLVKVDYLQFEVRSSFQPLSPILWSIPFRLIRIQKLYRPRRDSY